MPLAVTVLTQEPGLLALSPDVVDAVLGAAGLARAPSAAVALVVGLGDPAPADGLMRAGVPHLHLVGAGDHVQVGPFVAPGLTACLRCVAAHDPLAEPAPPDPALLLAGLALAARDLARWPAEVPLSWSRTFRIGDDLEVLPRRWPRHPHCGCAWDVAV